MRWAILVLAMFLTPAAALATDLSRLIGDCHDARTLETCEVTRRGFPADWALANKGDYQAQRNVAYCLSNGCDGAIVIDKTAGCAWRMVILASDAVVDQTDVMNYTAECRMDGGDAVVMAKLLFRKIYKRSMPPIQ
jgi:hypothetical protein